MDFWWYRVILSAEITLYTAMKRTSDLTLTEQLSRVHISVEERIAEAQILSALFIIIIIKCGTRFIQFWG